MAALIVLLLNLVASPFKPKSQLEVENAALRQQLTPGDAEGARRDPDAASI
jgi:hypothetical protein